MAQRDVRISQFISDRPPAIGVAVQLLCEDHVGTYTLPFLCCYTQAGWISVTTQQPIDVDVLGWRLAPAVVRRRTQTDGLS